MPRQAPLSHKRDAHRIEFLCFAVTGYDWAVKLSICITKTRTAFQNFYAKLKIVVQIDMETKATATIDETGSKSTDVNAILCVSWGRSSGLNHFSNEKY